MKKQSKKLAIRYCGHCRAEMTICQKSANECFKLNHWDEPEYEPIASKYDKMSGKENFAQVYKCPNYKKLRWYQAVETHDYYLEFDGKFFKQNSLND